MHTSAIETQAGWNARVSQITFHTCTPDNFTYLIPTFKEKNMLVPLLHNKWILLTQNSFGFNFIVSGFLVLYCRVYTSVLHGELKIYGQVLAWACCFLLGKGVMFVHLEKV